MELSINKQDVIILGVGGREGKGRKMKQFEVASLFPVRGGGNKQGIAEGDKNNERKRKDYN